MYFNPLIILSVNYNRTGSNPVIKRNKIFGGKNGGVLIYNSGKKGLYNAIYWKKNF